MTAKPTTFDYTDTQGRTLYYSIVDKLGGTVYSFSTNAFVPLADPAPADTIQPLTRLAGTPWSSVLVGVIPPGLTTPTNSPNVIAYVHDGPAGQVIDSVKLEPFAYLRWNYGPIGTF